MPSLRKGEIPFEAQYLYRRALDMKDNGKTKDALKYLKMAVTAAPCFSNAYNVMGNCLDEMGRYEEAITKYGKVLEFKPDDAEARFKQELVKKKIQYPGIRPEPGEEQSSDFYLNIPELKL